MSEYETRRYKITAKKEQLDILEYFKEGITYNEWKKRINSIKVHEKKFEEMVLFLLIRSVIDCVNGKFCWNHEYVQAYIKSYKRAPNFCIEHIKFFEEWVNPRTMEETSND